MNESSRDESSGIRRLCARWGAWPPLPFTMVVIGVAAALQLALDQAGPGRLHYVALYPAVLACALAAGWRYGLLALLASAGVVIVLERGPFDATFLAGLGVFAAGNLVVIGLAESSRRARCRAEAAAAAARASERATRSEAAGATRARDDLLATLSHELRTPLSVIVLWSRLLERKFASAGAELGQGLALIVDNGMALSQMINDLLDMSRIEAGRLALDLQPVDAAALVGQAAASHRPAAEAKHITLDCDVGPEPRIVLGDPARLQQVLSHLLANAVKFTPEAGHIRVTVRPAGNLLEIQVSDDGEGIAPESLPHVFSRLRPADGTGGRRHGGLGLGLPFVKPVVELHGGTVRAASDGARPGAVFTVTLPLHPSAIEPSRDTAPARPA